MTAFTELTSKPIWHNFYLLTQIPRPSGHTEKVQKFLVKFGKDLGLESFIDKAGNVVIRKPATPGMENRQGVILQAHMDMVPQKEVDKEHDFVTDPIEILIDGDWLKANGTTLGADNGMGVAAIMSILEDKHIKHGPLEALITRDEETGMYGAFQLQPDTLKGKILLNLDSETEGELYIGCAGGVDIESSLEYKEEPAIEGWVPKEIVLKGLLGGHSGMEIGIGRGNAIKIITRVVHDLINEFDCRLVKLAGGNMRNAIPRHAQAVLLFNPEEISDLEKYIDDYQKMLQEEFHPIEKHLSLAIKDVKMPQAMLPVEIQDNLIDALMACHNGVLRVIPTIPDTVETSSNLAIVEIGDGKADFKILARSASDNMKDYLADCLTACFNMAGMKTTQSGAYSGWEPNVNSPILKAMKKSYKKQFGEDARVKVIHAGLECGIIGAIYPKLDMISFGPTLQSPHTPSERVLIPSVGKFYDFLVATLGQIPENE